MFRSKVTVTLRKSILDPQGKAVEHGLHSLGMNDIAQVRIGKYIEFDVHAESREEAERLSREACEKLLANPVMEDFSFIVEKAETPVNA